MPGYRKPEKVRIVYFTGTGGTRRAAESLAGAFEGRGVPVIVYELSRKGWPTDEEPSFLLILYPVYALNAPEPVLDYITQLPEGDGAPAAVIAVSGGGEASPNTACRVGCIRKLEKKGYMVVYESMLVMPPNCFYSIPDELAVLLLKVLPVKTGRIAADIVAGVSLRIKPNLFDRILSTIAVVERVGGRLFGKQIKVGDGCTGCGLCAASCPGVNISMEDRVPVFNDRCLFCLRCIYGCPQHALQPGLGKFFVLEQGYDLRKLDNRAETGQSDMPDADRIKAMTIGYLLSGLRKYLLDMH